MIPDFRRKFRVRKLFISQPLRCQSKTPEPLGCQFHMALPIYCFAFVFIMTFVCFVSILLKSRCVYRIPTQSLHDSFAFFISSPPSIQLVLSPANGGHPLTFSSCLAAVVILRKCSHFWRILIRCLTRIAPIS